MSYQYAVIETIISDLIPASDGNESETAAIGRTLDGVSSFIDRFCRRPPGYFLPVAEDAQATVKYLTGEGERFLRSPIYKGEATIVGVDESLYYRENSTGWLFAKPYPSESLPIDSSYLSRSGFARGVIYQVEAIWGFEETPGAIVEAARELTVRTWETGRGIFGQINPATGVVIERAMPPFVEEILLGFRRGQFDL